MQQMHLVWQDSGLPISGVMIAKLVRELHSCKHCADLYDGVEVCVMEKSRRTILLRMV